MSPEQVEAVRAAVAGGQPVAAVARSFGISRPTISKALGAHQ
ncbi:helix-turn-helix domain-containing protein [Micrococcus lacusdianchii]